MTTHCLARSPARLWGCRGHGPSIGPGISPGISPSLLRERRQRELRAKQAARSIFMDGYEPATAMKADPRFKDVPIVMIEMMCVLCIHRARPWSPSSK